MGDMLRPFTVASLAERWECSTHAVYALIREKRLPAFRVGGKLLRIRAEVSRDTTASGNNYGYEDQEEGLAMFERKPTVINLNAPVRTETQFVTREIHEHRAPTDESVRLLKEFEEKAQAKVLEAVRLEGNGFECVVHREYDCMSDAYKYRAVFALNGKRMKAEVSAIGDDQVKGWLHLQDEIAKVISTEVLSVALRASTTHKMK